VYGRFLAAAARRAAPVADTGPPADPRRQPVIGVVLLDERDGELPGYYGRFASALRAAAPCRPELVPLPAGGTLDLTGLGDLDPDGVLVGGGRTPAYADALVPVAADLRRFLIDGRAAFAGFSAGAAVAPARALVGGWRCGGEPVVDEDAGEDLDEVEVRGGLGLATVTVDVHAAQWGTVPRLVAAVRGGLAAGGWAIDEDTAVHLLDGDPAEVLGLGGVHVVAADGSVRTVTAGARLNHPPDRA
jgi:cyanophycinase